MQEYVEERTIAISVKAVKLSGKVLAAACKKVFAEIAKQQEAAKRPKGRQSVRKLMNHHGGMVMFITRIFVYQFQIAVKSFLCHAFIMYSRRSN